MRMFARSQTPAVLATTSTPAINSSINGANMFANLKTILLAIIIVIGLFGNILNLIVFGKKHMRQIRTYRFLFFLSAVDILVLLTGTTDILIRHLFLFEIRNYSNAMCRLHTFVTYCVTQMSSILLMVVSIHRALDMIDMSAFTTRKHSLEHKSVANAKSEISYRKGLETIHITFDESKKSVHTASERSCLFKLKKKRTPSNCCQHAPECVMLTDSRLG